MNTLSFISFSDTEPALEIAAKYDHVCTIFGSRRLRCWGLNLNQQLGDSTFYDRGSGLYLDSITSAKFVMFAPALNGQAVSGVAVGR